SESARIVVAPADRRPHPPPPPYCRVDLAVRVVAHDGPPRLSAVLRLPRHHVLPVGLDRDAVTVVVRPDTRRHLPPYPEGRVEVARIRPPRSGQEEKHRAEHPAQQVANHGSPRPALRMGIANQYDP